MVTSIYAAIIAIMLTVLSIYVIKGRRKYGAGIGDGNNIHMQRRIRAQANLIEYSPIFIILLGFAESEGLSLWLVNLLALIFLAGRIMHAYSILKAERYVDYKLINNPTWRILGMSCTFSILLLLSVIIFIQNAYQFLL